jgi:serpin B
MAFILLGLSCSSPDPSELPDVGTLVHDNSAFACDLYRKLATGEENLMFSPYSISTVMAMTYAGARGNTATEMASTLRFSLDQPHLHPAFAGIEASLDGVTKDGSIRLSVANSLWPQKGYPFLRHYNSLIKKRYGVSIHAVDFEQAAEDARTQINGWAEDQTEGRIKDLIAPGILNSLTRLVLANAVYFKGKWANEFMPKYTRDVPFHVTADRIVQAPMMTQKLTCQYASHPSLDIVALPYRGDGMAMVVLLPKEVDGLRQLEGELTAEALDGWLDPLVEQKVLVSLPRFKVTSMLRLEDALRSLGMVDAFDPSRADFSGIDGRTAWLFISAVLQKAFVEVNEEGTEAAAATAVVATLGVPPAGPPPAVFWADHPFLFLIRETSTGSILFMGKLSDPTKTGE